MVTFGVLIREQGNTTKEGIFGIQGEQEELCGSKVGLEEEGRYPSRGQITSHGRTCVALRWIRWIELGDLFLS